MKKILFSFVLVAGAIGFFMVNDSQAGSGLCYLCSSGSSCQYCVSASGKDSSADRKNCEAKGCRVSGTASCPTASNYKVCR